MIKVIIGPKGSGKTRKLVDDLNAHAQEENTNVVCIERGARLDSFVNYRIRLVDISEYPIANYDQLLSFIAGLCAKDYDISDIYIDSIRKVAQDESDEALADFLAKLEPFAARHEITCYVILSADPDKLPEGITRYQAASNPA